VLDNFVHIPKSSGSTLRTILSRQYGVDHILYFEPASPSWKGTSPADFLREKLKKGTIDLITGHHPFGIHALIGSPCRSFSIIRDPIARALSDYYYAYNYKLHRLRAEILEGSLSAEQFLVSPRFGMQQAQTGMLAGRLVGPGDVFEAAFENTKHCFAAVGTAERFEESVLYVAKTLGWRPPLFVKKNVTRLAPDIEQARKIAEATARVQYRDHFALEYKIYAHVDALLSERINAEGEPFKRALEAYRGIQSEIVSASTDEIYQLYEFRETDKLPPFAERFVGSEPYRTIAEYLDSGPPAKPQPRNYVGFVDRMAGSTIAGWAQDLWRDDPIEVCIYRAGSLIATQRSDRPREDVGRAHGGRSNVGFHVELAEPIDDPAKYRICFEGTALQVWNAGSSSQL